MEQNTTGVADCFAAQSELKRFKRREIRKSLFAAGSYGTSKKHTSLARRLRQSFIAVVAGVGPHLQLGEPEGAVSDLS